jgi:hypothetical protein
MSHLVIIILFSFECIHLFRFDESFFTYCGKELTKINTFYAEKLAEATRKFATLKNEMEGSEYEQLTNRQAVRWSQGIGEKCFITFFCG